MTSLTLSTTKMGRPSVTHARRQLSPSCYRSCGIPASVRRTGHTKHLDEVHRALT